MANVKAKVTFEYDATEDDELTLAVGDIVTNIDQMDGGWWEGELKGKRGVFPENFVEVIHEEPSPALSKPPLPSLPPKTKAVVTFDYDAVEPDELSLKEGETIDVVKQEDGGWWEGICRGKTGVFPSNFVEIVKDSTQKDMNSLPDLPPKEPKASPPEGELMSFDEKQIEEQLSSSPPQRPPPVEEDTKKPKVPSGMGFAISSADLFKAKLRPVSIVDDPKKPIQTVEPFKSHDRSEPVSKARELNDAGNLKRNAPAPPQENESSTAEEQRYKVVYDYSPENDDELTLKKGDSVIVTNKDICDGWWEGTSNGKSGVFPNNFVELLSAAETVTKEKPVQKKAMVPVASKAPAIPSRDHKEDLLEPKALLPKKPILPDLKKPSAPEFKKPPLPDVKKAPDLKRPPPLTKGKPVPPRPNEKPATEETNTLDSIRNRLSTTGLHMPPPSLGRKPTPSQPNGFGRTFSGSIKKPVPAPPSDSKPEARPEHKKPEQRPEHKKPEQRPEHKRPEPKPDLKPVPVKSKIAEPDLSNGAEEQAVEWDMPPNAQVLSNVNKNRVKGPGKSLPGKYTQPKESPKASNESEAVQKSAPKGIKGESQSKSGAVEPSATPPIESSLLEGMKAKMDSMKDQIGNVEKKLLKHIEILTNDLDEERKQRATLLIEVDRLKKRVAILEGR